jgi:Protein of unknown function (DUF2423)
MAKGARASTKKANHQKLKTRVFGPVESARTERLSAKLLELATQPKPKPVKEDIAMESEEGMGYSSSIFIEVLTKYSGTAENNDIHTESKQTEGKTLSQNPSQHYLTLLCRDGGGPGCLKKQRSSKDLQQRPH